MDIPSRRARKQTKSKSAMRNLVLALFLLPGMSFIVYVAIFTGNYMGLATVALCVFFLLLGLNVGNIRRFLPGLASENKEIKFPAIFIYTCLGFIALTMASHLPMSDDFSPWETKELSTPQQEFITRREDSPTVPTDNTPADKLDKAGAGQTNHAPVTKPKEQVEQTTPVSKMETAAHNNVVTQIIDAQLIQVNNQRLVRLIGVQVPDSMQKQAVALLAEMLHNQEVSLIMCTERPQDEYGRTRAVVMANGINVNQKLIETGYSPLIVTYPSSIDFAGWQGAENAARKQKKGIWAKHPE